MKLVNLIRARNVLISHTGDKLQPKVAYKIMKLLKVSSDEDAFYNAKIKEFVEAYSERDTDGNMLSDTHGNIKINPEQIAECKKAMAEIEETDVEAPSIKFTIDELSGMALTVSEMYALDEFIIEEG